MTRRCTPLRIALVVIAATVTAACGDRDREPADPSATAPSTASTPEPVPTAGRCLPPTPLVAPSRSGDLREARARLDASVRAATGADHRFVTRISVQAGVRGPFTARLAGTRRAGGTSRAALRWSGAAGVLLPDAELVISRDRIRIRTGPGSPWRDAGSASGAALDVGRELLDHPFLLRAVRAREHDDRLDVELEAPSAQLRAYATAERRGPVTELLRGARSLRVTAHLDGDGLAGDSFRLVTTVPEGIPALAPLAGSVVRVVGITGSCALR